ncbi:MAG: PKD domain-containing protein [Bacteroidales bacterium]|nr:PKD domain-containing protein [Bacteroidales bacterium]
MKQFLLLFLMVGFLALTLTVSAQDEPISPTLTGVGEYHGLSTPLRDIPPMTDAEFQELVKKGERKLLNQKIRERQYPFAETALPQGPDQLWQKAMGETPNPKAPIVNFSGQNSPYYPPDCNGAVGPNHYMQTINTVYAIYNKSGGLVAGPTNMNQLFSGVTGSQYNDGDPIVLYDEQADRWLAAEFSISGSNDYMLIAVSATNDPTGSWHKYSFDVADMPDYEKFGIWQDGYYMGTNNSSGNDIYVFERSKMLVGATAQMVGFNNAWRPSTIDGFMCVPPVDNDGAFAPAGSPGLFITINDDAIGGGSDQLWIYELDVNWSSTSSSTFTRVQQLAVSPFDSNFGNNWDNIKQPGTTRELDAIPMVIMNRPQYRNFGSYQSLVCCHTVDVDATDHAGIRWYELRKTTGTWYVRQSGTYAPDSHSRWMGSIVLNGTGELGMGYSVSSTSVYPGIRYTGQSASAYAAASGLLDVEEGIIQNGSSSQTGANRWGDYANISIDPNDDHTFWFTSEYGGSRQTKIAAFEFAPPPLAAEFSGTPTNICPGDAVNFTDMSTGSPTSWNWSFPGGSPSSFNGQTPPAITYNTPGTYNVTLTVGDGSSTDPETKTGYITVANLTANFSASPTNVTIGNTVNFTDLTSCNPTSWSWSFPGGTPSTSTAQNPVVTYNTLGTYEVTLVASDGTNSDPETKTGYITVSEVQLNYCTSQGNNSSYEWIGQVVFDAFTNTSGASGYTDFTNLTVDMTAGADVNVSLTPQFSGSTYVEFWKVWIDYNKNGDFLDAGEEVFAPASSSTTVSGSFTVSASASGTTRMRVSMKWNAAQTACEVFSYGEVEDYTVNFGSLSPPVANFAANATTVIEGNSVQFTDLSTNAPTSWTWSFAGGTPGSSSSQNPVVTYNTAGTYTVSLTATNAAGSDLETKTAYINVVALPSCANLVSPANAATGVALSTNLNWDQAADATGYTLYFGTNNPPTNINNGTNLGNVTSFNPPANLNYNTIYYWRVIPYNANGSASGCAVWSFTTEIEVLPAPDCTTPVSPLNGATSVAAGTMLEWDAVTNANNYTLYFGTNNPPTNIVNGSNLGNVTFYSPVGNLNYNTNYYWSVVPSATGGSASGCAVWSFTTEEEPTGPVQLLFTDFESGFGLWTSGGSDCLLYTSGTYAAGGNNAGDIQDNSGVASSFYLTNGIDVHSPGYVQIDISFDFVMISMETNEDFWVQYYNGSTWSTVATYAQGSSYQNGIFYNESLTLFESEYNFPTNMNIRFMCDASGNADDVYIDNISITAVATLAPPECAVPLSPADASTDVSISANLEWDAAPNATGYMLFFGSNNPPTNIVNGVDLGDVLSFNPASDLLNNTAYYWQIIPYNNEGPASGCSVWSFTTEAVTSIFDELSFTDFESGFSIWTDGGGDCALYTSGSYASEGNNAADIQDNSGVASSFYLTNGVDVHTPGYVQIDVEFDFYAVSMDGPAEDFWVQYFDGSVWHTVASYAQSTDFQNNVFYTAKINIFESDYNFPTGMKIRFMCDASGNVDDIYIDQIRISAGTQTSPDEFFVAKSSGSKTLFVEEAGDSESIHVFPNPTHNILNINISTGETAQFFVFDMNGKLIYKAAMAEHYALDMNDFENGMYILNVITENENYTQKIIKR